MARRIGPAVYLVSVAAGLTGVTALLRRRLRRTGSRLFILAYHDVGDVGDEREGVVSQQRFRRHIRLLKRRYRFETVSGAVQAIDDAGPSSEDRVVVTFDDGLAGVYRWAMPVLRDEGVPATVFLTTGFLDGQELWFDYARRALNAASQSPSKLPGETLDLLQGTFGSWPAAAGVDRLVGHLKYLEVDRRNRLLDSLRAADFPVADPVRPVSWDQVREMVSSGIEMGAHTVTHPILSMLPPSLQESEIAESRRRIEEETGRAPTSFAFPNGSRRDFSRDTVELLRAHRFLAVCTMIRGSNAAGSDPLMLRRIGVGADADVVLSARLAGLFDDEPRRWIGAVLGSRALERHTAGG